MKVGIDAEYAPNAHVVATVPAAEAAESFDSVTAAIMSCDGDSVILTAGAHQPLFKATATIVKPGDAGSLRRLYFYTDRSGVPHTVASRVVPDGIPCDALSTVSGLMTINADGSGTIAGDIHVPAHIIAQNGLTADIYVSCTVLQSPAGRIALTAIPYTD